MIRVKTRQHGSPDIGIAPLVDCVFLLLIFFLLTSSFSEQRGIRIELPKSSTAQDAEKENLEIVVSETGEIVFQGRPTAISALTTALQNAVVQQGKAPVLMKADRLVPLEKVIEVIDCVRAANLETVSIATQKKPENNTRQ